VCKVGIIPALESKLKALEQRQRELGPEIRAAEVSLKLPDRAAMATEWRALVDSLNELPRLLNSQGEIETARAPLKEYIS
jgi:hypothetical protein